MAKVKGKTKSGFEYVVDDDKIVDNWRFTKLYARVKKAGATEDGTVASVELLELLFGEEQLERLAEHEEKIHGVATNTAMFEEFGEVVQHIAELRNDTKNS